jgi:hypothetical protein
MKPIHRAIQCAVVFFILLQLSIVPVRAEVLEQSLLAHYPAGSINSAELAKMALTEVDVVRDEIERRFAQSRADCMDKFFMSRCIADAKEIRRAALYNIRKIEVEANAFLRKDRAADRERKIAERQNRAVRPLDGPSIPISGAARESANPTAEPATGAPSQPEKP